MRANHDIMHPLFQPALEGGRKKNPSTTRATDRRYNVEHASRVSRAASSSGNTLFCSVEMRTKRSHCRPSAPKQDPTDRSQAQRTDSRLESELGKLYGELNA